MASTYALPVSAMHHTHVHSHSHSLSPTRVAPSQKRSLRHEKSTGSLPIYAQAALPYNQHHVQVSSNNHGYLPSLTDHHRPASPLRFSCGPDADTSETHSRLHSTLLTPNQSQPVTPFKEETGTSTTVSPHNAHGSHSHDSYFPELYSHDSHSHKPNSYEFHSPDLHSNDSHSHNSDGHIRKHDHAPSHSSHSHRQSEKSSRFTKLLLHCTKGSSLMESILLEKDSRRIFYFMSLNFAFMMVQAFYGFVTDSLGLLSDSIHMFFDCLALALGLFAAVSSKWPPSQRFPYGFAKIEILSGFGNGIFLMLISVEIIIEATERLAEGRETKRLGELFVISSLGLAVNLVGMACFGHHHHGHDHSHGHAHSEGHIHSLSHAEHDHEHPNTNSCSERHDHDYHDHHIHDHGDGTPVSSSTVTSSPSSPTPNHKVYPHSHSHENENMRGIFLHVLADTMGSAAVVVSTILIHFIGWPGWDPLASCIIAVLIFASSLPLVSSCARRLLLTVSADTEYQLRNTLADVSELRGVASYSVPRFWMCEKAGEAEGDKVLGVIHVIAVRGADLDDVRERTRALLSSHGMDAVIQVEREGDAKCWCGGDADRSPSTSRYS